ncbi:MAG: glycerol-3-phosphate 1-O-acyltransferase PlsY [Deinococcus sp.]|nr:glycerol-3-phosphate 1-O-acyltransferase PlsY [Deinococcus sp.]
MREILAILGAYLLGSVTFGAIIARFYGKDLRQLGSGNIGGTNVVRALGWLPGLVVTALDALKGATAVYLARRLGFGEWTVAACALVAVLGHSYSLFLRFRGGKGAATGLGILLALSPWAGTYAVLVGLIPILLTGFVSLGSLTGAISSVFFMWLTTGSVPDTLFSLIIAATIIYRHRDNIKRLRAGQENKLF